MPGFNQTGPSGMGAMTGRKMGRCSTYGMNLRRQATKTEEQTNENRNESMQGKGFGFGCGNAMGSGRGRCFGLGQQHRFRGAW